MTDDIKINVNYDEPATKSKFFDVRVVKPLLISCAISNSGEHNVVW